MRRLTWLRTMTWFARRRAGWSRHPGSAATNERLNVHIEAHIAQSFDPATIAKIRAEWLEGLSVVKS